MSENDKSSHLTSPELFHIAFVQLAKGFTLNREMKKLKLVKI